MKNSYQLFKEKRQKEFDEVLGKYAFFFAYSQEQFEKGMKKFGLDPNKDVSKICKFCHGGYCKKSDLDKIHELFDKTEKERKELIASDTDGSKFIADMFECEMADHEYIINQNDGELLEWCDIDFEEYDTNKALQNGFVIAYKRYMKNINN